MRRILYVSPFAFDVSGADESLLTIVRTLPDTEYNVHVAVPKGSPYAGRYQEAGATVHEMHLSRLKRTINPFYWLLFLLRLPLEVFALRGLVDRHQIDLIHVNMESIISPAIAGKMARRPIVLHYRGKVKDTPKVFFDFYLPLLCRLSDHIFAISAASGSGFTKRNLPMEPLHNAVQIEKFSREASQDYFEMKRPEWKGKRVVTLIGRLDPQKRIIDFLKAAQIVCAKHFDVAFAVVGGDPNMLSEVEHKAELDAYISGLKTKPDIHFFGSERDIPSVLQSSALFVLPSVDEGFGRSVVEAMIAGVPVIAAESGAFPEVLENGKYGKLVPPYRPDLLAEAIEEDLTGAAAAKERAKLAKEYAYSNFSIEKHVRRLMEVYDRFLS